MYVQDVIGELLYIGIVAEKGRCYGTWWKLGYKKILRRHIIALNELQKCLQSIDEKLVRIVINNFIAVCDENREIGKFYNFSCKQMEDFSSGKDFNMINQLISELFFELVKEIEKPYLCKRKVYELLCALHNLPRVYLGKNKETLCKLNQEAISEQDAIKYMIGNMNSVMRKNMKIDDILERREIVRI